MEKGLWKDVFPSDDGDFTFISDSQEGSVKHEHQESFSDLVYHTPNRTSLNVRTLQSQSPQTQKVVSKQANKRSNAPSKTNIDH